MPENSKKSTYITFDNTNYNLSEVYVQISANGLGTGEKMTDQGGNYYTYQIPKEFEECKTLNVRFSDGKGNTISEYNNKPLMMTYMSYGITNSSGWNTNYLGMAGDFNNDGKVTSKDSLEILRIAISQSKTNSVMKMIGDINMDGSITAKDAMYVLRYSINYQDNTFIGEVISL